MTQDFERLVEAWLEDTASPIPDPIHIYPAVAAGIARRPRHRLSWLRPLDLRRSRSLFSATNFVLVGVIVALFGGLLLSVVVTTQPEETRPAVGASATPESTTIPPIELPAEIPEGIESGTLDTPLGPARWVHLRGDASTLPAELAPVAVPLGYVTLASEDGRARLWRSAELVEWSEEPMPVEAEWGELTLADGTYWMTTSGPSSLWRSQDTLEWTQVGLGGLVSPGPDGYAWDLLLGPPLAHDGATIVPYTYSVPYRGAFLGLAGRLGRPVRLREVEPGLYDVGPEPDYRTEATIRFEETGSGLRVTDNADGTELTILDGVSMEFIERWAAGDRGGPVRGLGVLDEDMLASVDLPDLMRQASAPQLLVDGSGFVAYSLTPDGMLRVHRSEDGRVWTEADTIGDDPGEPTDIEYVTTAQGTLVVGFESNTEWTSTDGVTWETSRRPEDVGMPFASGSLYPAGQPVPWYGPDPGEDPGPDAIDNTMWYQPSGGEPMAIDVSDLGFSDTPEVDSSGSGGLVSADTLVRTFSADEGDSPRLREVWIITFDEVPS